MDESTLISIVIEHLRHADMIARFGRPIPSGTVPLPGVPTSGGNYVVSTQIPIGRGRKAGADVCFFFSDRDGGPSVDISRIGVAGRDITGLLSYETLASISVAIESRIRSARIAEIPPTSAEAVRIPHAAIEASGRSGLTSKTEKGIVSKQTSHKACREAGMATEKRANIDSATTNHVPRPCGEGAVSSFFSMVGTIVAKISGTSPKEAVEQYCKASSCRRQGSGQISVKV